MESRQTLSYCIRATRSPDKQRRYCVIAELSTHAHACFIRIEKRQRFLCACAHHVLTYITGRTRRQNGGEFNYRGFPRSKSRARIITAASGDAYVTKTHFGLRPLEHSCLRIVASFNYAVYIGDAL